MYARTYTTLFPLAGVFVVFIGLVLSTQPARDCAAARALTALPVVVGTNRIATYKVHCISRARPESIFLTRIYRCRGREADELLELIVHLRGATDARSSEPF